MGIAVFVLPDSRPTIRHQKIQLMNKYQKVNFFFMFIRRFIIRFFAWIF